MVFSSSVFIFLFLPLALLGYQLAGRFGRRASFAWLVIASLVFYSYWDPRFVFVLAGSMLFNFLMSRLIVRSRHAQAWLTFAIVANLGALVFFKYLFPLLNWFHGMGLSSHAWQNVALPLGISFFTFTQIAYLVDLTQGMAEEQGLLSYALFVTFFPHLIAGPIIHHREMMPQFNQLTRQGKIAPEGEPTTVAEMISGSHLAAGIGTAAEIGSPRRGLHAPDMAIGLTWFVMGLGKKVLIADAVANLPNEFYGHPHLYGFGATWMAVLAYAVELYFDFSGYSDMAMGLARMFSIHFPLNFHSPYKSTSIIDYWQRWHMTLTRYLTMYVYNPIALHMNRRRMAAGRKMSKKATRSLSGFVELIAWPIGTTMFLAGVWHGAGLQFLLFGLAHAGFLITNHAWRIFVPEHSRWQKLLPAPVCVLLTFLAVVGAQVFFRAESARDAFYVLGTMTGIHGLAARTAMSAYIPAGYMSSPVMGALALGIAFLIIWGMPNTQEILGQLPDDLRQAPSLLPRLRWAPSLLWGVVFSLIFVRIVASLETSTSFLYFQF